MTLSRNGGPPEPTHADLDALAIEDERNRTLATLGEMSPAEYGRRRTEISTELEIPLGWLDAEYKERRKSIGGMGHPPPRFLEPPEQWPNPVRPAALLNEIERTLLRYVVLPDHAAPAIALWVAHAHALVSTALTPILAIESPEKRCGKTTLLSLLQPMVPKALTAANMTAATAFRAVEEFQPTLVVDEGDTFLTTDKGELIGIFNSGHTRTSAFVLRTVGDNHEVKRFSTWCPKIIALIGELPPTLQDRSVVIPMRRRQRDEKVERRRADRNADLEIICRKAARWASDNAEALADCDPDVPDQMDDRAADNWRPLLAIAELAGEHWPATAREAALVLSGARSDDDDGGGVLLLRDIREVLGRDDWLTPTRLVERLVELPESPWPEWRRGKPITARGVARLLKPFSIKSEEGRVEGDKKRRYYRANFEDAWARYLTPAHTPSPDSTPITSGTNGTALKNKGKVDLATETADSACLTSDDQETLWN